MIFEVQAWTYDYEEEPGPIEMVASEQFENIGDAQAWAWEKMEEGFSVRMFRL